MWCSKCRRKCYFTLLQSVPIERHKKLGLHGWKVGCTSASWSQRIQEAYQLNYQYCLLITQFLSEVIVPTFICNALVVHASLYGTLVSRYLWGYIALMANFYTHQGWKQVVFPLVQERQGCWLPVPVSRHLLSHSAYSLHPTFSATSVHGWNHSSGQQTHFSPVYAARKWFSGPPNAAVNMTK